MLTYATCDRHEFHTWTVWMLTDLSIGNLRLLLGLYGNCDQHPPIS